jgi:hypothetical protein
MDDDLWQLAEFCMSEAFLLRSFLENLRLRTDLTAEQRMERLADWKRAVGRELGNTLVCDLATAALRTARDGPPRQKSEAIQGALAAAREQYFFS